MSKNVPFAALKRLSKEYDLDHIIMFSTQGDTQWVTTYGNTLKACDEAAQFGNEMREKLGWPESLKREPSRVRKLQARIKELEQQNKALESKSMTAHTNDVRGEGMRNPYEQQEYQRTHPELFTTPYHSVNADGSIIAYEKVTQKLRETREKIVANAQILAASKGLSTEYWFLLSDNETAKQSVDYLDAEMQKCLSGFTENYARMHGMQKQPPTTSGGAV
jgi:hypothetical protein